MQMDRIWAMPNKNTFEIPPIKDLIISEVKKGGLWIDPFANKNKFADITNDLNPKYDTDYHLDALDFLKIFNDESVDGVLYDPPYSTRQVKECYDGIGRKVTNIDTRSDFWTKQKQEITRIVKNGGTVISFGWNSNGIGKTNGFEIVKILLVAHGGCHNDTICTVEKKTSEPIKKQEKITNQILTTEEYLNVTKNKTSLLALQVKNGKVETKKKQ